MANNQETIQGIARNVEWRTIEDHSQLTFRIEVTDEVGNVKEIVPVEMVGVLKGNLSDGDEVKVEGIRGEDGILKPDNFPNLTTKGEVGKYGMGEWIKASTGRFSGSGGAKWILGPFIGIVIGIAILVIVLFILLFVFSHKSRQRYRNEAKIRNDEYQAAVEEMQREYDKDVNEYQKWFEEKQREFREARMSSQEESSEKVKEWEENKRKREEELERRRKEMEKKVEEIRRRMKEMID